MKSIDINGYIGSSKSISCAGGMDQNGRGSCGASGTSGSTKGGGRKVSGTVGVDMIGGENEKNGTCGGNIGNCGKASVSSSSGKSGRRGGRISSGGNG